REREDAERSHALSTQDPADLGEARLGVDLRNDERVLRLPDEARGGLRHGQLEVGREARRKGDDGVKAHDVAIRIVEHDREPVEAGDPAQQTGEIAQEALQISMRRGGMRHVEQHPVEVAGRAHAVFDRSRVMFDTRNSHERISRTRASVSENMPRPDSLCSGAFYLKPYPRARATEHGCLGDRRLGPEGMAKRSLRGLALLDRDRALRPERRIRTARVATDSCRDEDILPGKERAYARK